MGSPSADYGACKDEYEWTVYLFVMSMESPIRIKNRQVMGSSSADYESSKDGNEWGAYLFVMSTQSQILKREGYTGDGFWQWKQAMMSTN